MRESYNGDMSTLMRGTSENKKKLMEFIDEVEAGGSTCGKCGIKKAFSIFKASTNYEDIIIKTPLDAVEL